MQPRTTARGAGHRGGRDLRVDDDVAHEFRLGGPRLAPHAGTDRLNHGFMVTTQPSHSLLTGCPRILVDVEGRPVHGKATMNKAIIGISSAALAAGLGLGVTQLATADEEAPSPTPTASASQEPGQSQDGTAQDQEGRRGPGGPGGHHEGRGPGGFDTAELAEKLGVEESELSEALDAVRESQRPAQQDAAKGADSSEASQEDLSAAHEERQAAFASALAEELGIDEATVTSAMEELRAAAESEREASEKQVLADAVSEGTLTQEEADAVQKAAEAGIVRIDQGPGGER